LKLDQKKLFQISYGMSQMAKTYPNDLISNNLARVSEKVAALGASFGGSKLSALDYKIIRFYLQKTA
jgi:hypothetical protein